MADLYVKATGSNTSPYDTWAKAATSLATVITLAAANDHIYVHNGFSETGLASTTYAPAAGVQIYSTSDTVNQPPTTYAAGASVATTTTGGFTINGGGWLGFTFKNGSGSSTATMAICAADNSSVSFEGCSFQLVSTGAGCLFNIGGSSASTGNCAIRTRGCNFIFAATGQSITCRGLWYDEGSIIDAGASHPVALIKSISLSASMFFYGSDFSANANTLFPDGASWYVATMVNCKLNANATIQATLSSDAAGEVYGYDCAAGNVQYNFFHYNYRGNTVAATAKYITADGASYDATGDRYSWTCTSVNGTYDKPYFTPWMAAYNAGLVAITPYLEIARDGSATAYNDDQVWAEWLVKTTSNVCLGTFYTDRKVPLATAAAQAVGIGTGSWTGLSGTANSMKCDTGAAVTPAVIGNVLARLALTGTAAVSLDPYMRGLSASASLMRTNGAGFMNGFASGTSGIMAVGSSG